MWTIWASKWLLKAGTKPRHGHYLERCCRFSTNPWQTARHGGIVAVQVPGSTNGWPYGGKNRVKSDVSRTHKVAK